MKQEWKHFTQGLWCDEINVRDFIQLNYAPYNGDGAFLAAATERTKRLWGRCQELLAAEQAKGGVLDVDTQVVSTLTSHKAGYIVQQDELIVGLQTDAPLKRGVIVNGGIRMAEQACEAYGYKLNPGISELYHSRCMTHNTAVFNAYTEEMKQARRLGIITGLPDAYGRGRVIGDYRRVALYGIDRLCQAKQQDLTKLAAQPMQEEIIRLREELSMQLSALEDMAVMAAEYGYDIRRPAANAREAFQWLYFGYLAAIKEQNGAAMSLGRVSTFLDIYMERDLKAGVLAEADAQELMDQFVIKLRLARQLRTPDYNELFAGDPLWVTEAIGGIGEDGRPLVTKSSFRILHTLYNLGPAPEPNLTVLWSAKLPPGFKQYCAQASIDTSAIQYENDDIMRPVYGDDYAIACCVSAMRLGERMQFFGARANLGKALLLALNGGRDEVTGEQLGPELEIPLGEYLDYSTVRANYSKVLDWLTGLYVNTLNLIHYMHDKYAYERAQMALHDTQVERLLACGVAGLSVAADSLSAIRYARVKPIRDSRGIAVGFQTEGEFPCYGNNNDRVDTLASELCREFALKIKAHATYRQAKHTLSVLTITSNVMYGHKTGATPDGRGAGEAFAPGANPMHGRDRHGALAAISSVTKLSYEDCRDGVSYTFSAVPGALGKTPEQRANNLAALLDGHAGKGGHHINVNVLERELLQDAAANPGKYPQLTIRVSGYAVNFNKLSAAQQQEVISRTFHQAV